MPDSYIIYVRFSPLHNMLLSLLQNFLICDNNKDFCLAFVNGKFCKDLALVTTNDFFSFGLNISRNTTKKVGSNVTLLIIDKLLGLSIRLDLCLQIHVCVSFLFYFFLFFIPAACFDFLAVSASMHCSQVTQTLLFNNFFFKNGSHNTIHTFKNYFAIMFSVFSSSKISSIQTDS